jgi:hypothetical protein
MWEFRTFHATNYGNSCYSIIRVYDNPAKLETTKSYFTNMEHKYNTRSRRKRKRERKEKDSIPPGKVAKLQSKVKSLIEENTRIEMERKRLEKENIIWEVLKSKPWWRNPEFDDESKAKRIREFLDVMDRFPLGSRWWIKKTFGINYLKKGDEVVIVRYSECQSYIYIKPVNHTHKEWKNNSLVQTNNLSDVFVPMDPYRNGTIHWIARDVQGYFKKGEKVIVTSSKWKQKWVDGKTKEDGSREYGKWVKDYRTITVKPIGNKYYLERASFMGAYCVCTAHDVREDVLSQVPVPFDDEPEPFDPENDHAEDYYAWKTIWWIKRPIKHYKRNQRVVICGSEPTQHTAHASIDLNDFRNGVRVYLSNLSFLPLDPQ